MDFLTFKETTVMIRKKEGFQGQRMIVLPRNLLSMQCTEDPVLAPLYITDIGYYPKARFHHMRRLQGAEQHILIYCKEGKGSITVAHETFQIQPGHCFLIPRKIPHEYSADVKDPWTIYWAHFLGSSADGLLETATREWQGYRTFLSWSTQRTALFDRSYDQLEKGFKLENLKYANMHFWSFLATCIYPHADHNTSPQHSSVDESIEFMRQHIDTMLSLQEMAAAVNLSQSHFSAVFKAGTGFSPIEYFNQLKIQEACQYLLFTSLRIKEIAGRLGMEDPYYFSRLFTKIMGLSPNQYRERKAGS
ncbi:AraC family transcriptional regulator [Chitinophaga sp.]|uniref:AraC family transcriptional regulator n=1 Tax=Chitinophaga sp. TaxID=1869181 RepID=UPI0025C72943|nr:AraC family transcriptional regulator [Chitinophaga sp.]